MEQNQKNVLTGLVIVLIVAGLVGFSVWGMTHLTLGKKIGQLYQEKMTFEEMLKNKDKEKEEALEKTIAQFKSVLQKKEQESEKRVGGCVEGGLEDVRSQVNPTVFDTIFSDDYIKSMRNKIEYATVCNFEGVGYGLFESSAFVFAGDFGKENQIIGFIPRKGNKTVVLTNISISTYPFGGCSIGGFIDGNLMYECVGGADGDAGGFSEAYILRKDTGESVLIKSCKSSSTDNGGDGIVRCDKNILNLPK